MARSPGRPPAPLEPDASSTAYLGAEIRGRRLARGWTLKVLSEQIGYSLQHVSEVERAKAAPTGPFVAACDQALGARGRLVDLLPAVEHERAVQRLQRAAARRCEAGAARYADDVDPTNRRGLLGAGAAAALGAAGVAAAPAGAREIDPGLVEHWTRLLSLLGRHNAMFGPQDALETVRHELTLIAGHRQLARGDIRAQLMRVESRWTAFAAWLSNDTGDVRSRDILTGRAGKLAEEAGYRDMVAFVHMRRSQWAAQGLDAQRAIAFAKAGRRIPGTSAQTRARCELRAAFGHALANDADACERSLAAAEGPLDDADDRSVQPWVGRATVRSHARPDEARCWLYMQPRKAIPLYEAVLREWPRDQRAMGACCIRLASRSPALPPVSRTAPPSRAARR
jgi:transcriptional regulator with XRE-family HTH domain